MTVFLVLGVAGLALLLVSLVLGDVLDGAFDALAGDVFSTAVIGAFVSATGFGGALGEAVGLPTAGSVAVGLVAGAGFAWVAAWLTRLVRGGGSDATVSTDDALGHAGRVVSAIPAEGYGSVSVFVGGHTLRLNARAGVPIEAGTEVHVTEVISPTAVAVAPVWNELP